jgi:hypothetical protein
MMVHFSVRDTGIGISKDDIGLLFQSFSQVGMPCLFACLADTCQTPSLPCMHQLSLSSGSCHPPASVQAAMPSAAPTL